MESTSLIYEKGTKVFSCCGQYIACTKATKEYTIKCPRCNAELKTPLKTPTIVIVKRS